MTQRSSPKRGDIVLLLGTRKGGFILSSDASRKSWSLSDPLFAGSDVFDLVSDPRVEGSVYAAVNSPIWGPEVQISRDLGQTWQGSTEGPKFSDGSESAVKRV